MSNYKRRAPRRQVRCALCTDNRTGNCGHVSLDLEDGERETPHRRAAAKKADKPFVIEWKILRSLWSRDWLTWRRYPTKARAEEALKQMQHARAGLGYLFRLRERGEEGR